MIKFNIEMPEVSTCKERRCAYNVDLSCRARAITIGDGISPMCDTFFSSTTHSHDTSRMAGVGACKVAACKHNNDFECHANNVEIETPGRHARCMTFAT